jgi:hypothetical protein
VAFIGAMVVTMKMETKISIMIHYKLAVQVSDIHNNAWTSEFGAGRVERVHEKEYWFFLFQ